MRELINVRESFLKRQQEEEGTASDKSTNGKNSLLMMIEGGQENPYSGETPGEMT